MIRRERYLRQISPFIDKPVVKAITGIRRSGKSTLLKMLCSQLSERGVAPSNILLINKDSLQFDWLQDYRQLGTYVADKFEEISGKKYLFIDEVQEIEGWEKALAGFLANDVADLYITGSNSRMLSSELATYISGRYVELKVYTLTFSEFLQFRDIRDSDQLDAEFYLFLKYGGFPGIHRMEYDDEVIGQYVSSVYDTILLKDVVARNGLRDIHLLERLIRFIADNCGNVTSAKKIADFLKSQHLKGSVDTVQNYLSMLTSANIFHKAGRYDIKGKRHLEIFEKYYVGDIGLKHNVRGYKMNDIAGYLENVVYLELLSRRYTVSVGKVNEQEIDFVASRGNEKMYIQVAYLLADSASIEREFGALERIADNYPKIVLSMDRLGDSNRNGIKWFNLIEFLRSELI